MTQTDLSIQMATHLLRHRLSTKAAIDFRILEPRALEEPVSLNNYYGTFLGLFSTRPNGSPVFYLFSRDSIGENIVKAIVFYMGNKIRRIQAHEKQILTRKLDNIDAISIVNIVSSAPSFCDWSIMVQCVEYALDSSVVQQLNSRHVLEALHGSELIAYNPNLSYPSNCVPHCDTSSRLEGELRSAGIRFHDYSYTEGNVYSDIFDVLRIHQDGHCLYAIYYAKYKALMFLLPHICQFTQQSSYQALVNAMRKSFPFTEPFYVGATRYYGSASSCKDILFLKACVLCLFQPLTIIKDCDLKSLVSDQDLDLALKALSQQRSAGGDLQAIEVQRSLPDDHTDPSNSVETATTTLAFGGPDGSPEVLSVASSGPSSAQSSQATEIYSQSGIEETIRRLGFALFMNRRLSRVYPPTDKDLDPMNDEHASFLLNRGVFLEQLDFCLEHWLISTTYSLFLPFEVDTDCDYNPDLSGPERFKVIPIFQSGNTSIAILDTEQEEWTVLDPNNSLKRIDERLYDFESLAIKKFSFLKDWIIIPMALSSYFHKEYPLIHLLMSVFYLGKIFRLAAHLPSRIIYGEKDFREYCYMLCLSLQISNLRYNHRQNLIAASGYLKPGAYISYPSPVFFERCVVPTDQCVFCGKRGWKNLTGHVRMSHGGGSALANKVRAEGR